VASSRPLPELLRFILDRTGYRKMLQAEKTPESETRLENLDELFKEQAATGKISIPIQRWEIAHGVYRFTLGASLEPGEYAMAEVVQGGATSLYFWDFGVDGNAATPPAGNKAK